MSVISSVELLLEGLVTTNSNLIYYKNHKIVTRQDNDRDDNATVKLICGGGSGHEPAHAGFVGHGMLTTAVCGNLFASPSVTAILNAILITGAPATQIILIVKNYTGDRLNFGLAAEIAKSKYGYQNIRMILIEDDVSIEDKNVRSSTGRRGLAGTVLIQKIIGSMADHKKMSIDEIFIEVEKILKLRSLCTMGFTFQSKIGEGLSNIEIGKGIHGEPGIQTLEHQTDFDGIIEILIEKFLRVIQKKDKVVVLVNNLGGTSEFLMNIFFASLFPKLQCYFQIVKIMTGTFLTSLNNEGISVTLLRVDENHDKIIECIDSPTTVPSNVFGTNKNHMKKPSITYDITPEMTIEKIKHTNDFGVKINPQLLEKILNNICEAVIKNAADLDRIDLEFGDGDTGSTLKNASLTILNLIKVRQFNFERPHLVFQEFSEIFQNNVGGTSGALYSIFFQAASAAFRNGDKNDEEMQLENWRNAIKWGNAAIMKYGLGKVGDRTMLDPLKCCEQLLFEYDGQLDNLDLIKRISDKCFQCAKNTQNMIPKSGRAAYSFAEDENKKCEYPDPGAMAVGIWIKSIYETCSIFYSTDFK